MGESADREEDLVFWFARLVAMRAEVDQVHEHCIVPAAVAVAVAVTWLT